jgi:endonuclease/exonuclease/phosphatase (EEP) superfamily protein YafD
LPIVVTVLGWVVVVVLAVVATMRIVAWDTFEPFAVLNTVSLFVYLPAWIVLVVAALGRRLILAAAALLIVVAQVVFVYPEFAAATPLPDWTARAPHIELLDANVYNLNPWMAGYIDQIEEVHPQLVTMEEATPPDVSQLKRSGALASLPYQIEIKRYDPSAFFIASRYPLVAENVVYQYRRPLIVQVTLELPSGPQRLWVTHTIAPLPSSFAQWKGQLSTISRLVRAAGAPGLLLVGDLNATWGSRGFRLILDAGLTDGAAARGEPLEMTWSQTKPLLPPVVRIDHVLTGSGVAVTAIRTGVGKGSDHRDVIATVAFRRSTHSGA